MLRQTHPTFRIFCTALLAIFFTLPLRAAHSSQPAVSNPDPTSTLSPLTDVVADQLQPGLLPHYFSKFFARNIYELPGAEEERNTGWSGKPILQLNHQFGRKTVFGSGSNRGVGMRMRGALHFPSPGNYTFQALSNDGILMFLGKTLVISDPEQHSDRLSGEGFVHIATAGWYPVRIDYFQRKGTAALKLYWKTPENNTMTIVPAGSYGHVAPQ